MVPNRGMQIQDFIPVLITKQINRNNCYSILALFIQCNTYPYYTKITIIVYQTFSKFIKITFF